MKKSISTLVLTIALVSTVAANATFGMTLNSTSQSLPQTNALQREIDLAQQSLASTSARLSRLQSAARSCRKKAEEVAAMVKKIKSVESQISRIEKQLSSFSKVPQLRMLKTVVSALGKVRAKVYSIRKQAEKVKRNAIDPTIQKIKSFEAEVYKVKQQVQYAISETNRAEQKINELKGYVASSNYPRPAVAALETLARGTRATVHPLRQMLYDIDKAGYDAEVKMNSFTKSLSSVTRLGSGLDKVQRDLAPIDKKARDLDKVLSKRFTLKIPFSKKRVSFTVRQILESPGKVVDVLLKPFTALAKKALSPLTKKLQFNIKAPREIEELISKLNSLQNKVVNLANAQAKMANAAKSRAISSYRTAMKKISSMSTSQLR